MDYSQLSRRDEDALFARIDGENDALILETPNSDDYYYLTGWHDTKNRIANGELNKVKERHLATSKVETQFLQAAEIIKNSKYPDDVISTKAIALVIAQYIESLIEDINEYPEEFFRENHRFWRDLDKAALAAERAAPQTIKCCTAPKSIEITDG